MDRVPVDRWKGQKVQDYGRSDKHWGDVGDVVVEQEDQKVVNPADQDEVGAENHIEDTYDDGNGVAVEDNCCRLKDNK